MDLETLNVSWGFLPEGSRKFNNGEVINTLHKFLPEEKAYDVHYTLQQQR